MHCNVYPIFVKFVRLTHSNKELLTYLLTYLLISIWHLYVSTIRYDTIALVCE